MGNKENKIKKKIKRCSSQSIDAKSIPISVGVNIQNNTISLSSWGAAFTAASTIRPNESDIDDEFLQRTKATKDSKDVEGLLNVARLAKCYDTKEPSSTEQKCNDEGDDSSSDKSTKSDDIPLEGRMIALSPDAGEQTMVLIDKQSGNVYSSVARTQNGKRLIIGNITEGTIQLDRDTIKALRHAEHDEEGASPSFPYATNPDDHCETPLDAYRDILPILDELSRASGCDKSKLRIYDPYYCNGSMIKHLESLGYTNVYNRKEDCYAVWESNKIPPFDVLLTNPPYSEDHIEKLMMHLTSSSFGSKPFLLLMPQWVHKKDYYINATTGGSRSQDKKRKRSNITPSKCNPFYIVPQKRYVYHPPPDFRNKKVSDTHKKSSPFTSMWFVWGGTHAMNETLIDAFRACGFNNCEIARSRSALRDLRRGGKKKAKPGK